MEVPATIECVDCLGTCHRLPREPEGGFAPGEVIAYRCEDCLDRWDIQFDPDGHSSLGDADGGDPNVIEVTANGATVANLDFEDALPSLGSPPAALAFSGRSIAGTAIAALLLVGLGAIAIRGSRREESLIQ